MRFPSDGKWWATRRDLSVETDGTVTVQFAVTAGDFALELTGTPDTLRAVAQAIEAQVLGAQINTPPLEPVRCRHFTTHVEGCPGCRTRADEIHAHYQLTGSTDSGD